MANDKKLVEAITSMDVDFAQWYTEVVKKAESVSYTHLDVYKRQYQYLRIHGKLPVRHIGTGRARRSRGRWRRGEQLRLWWRGKEITRCV